MGPSPERLELLSLLDWALKASSNDPVQAAAKLLGKCKDDIPLYLRLRNTLSMREPFECPQDLATYRRLDGRLLIAGTVLETKREEKLMATIEAFHAAIDIHFVMAVVAFEEAAKTREPSSKGDENG